MTAVLPHFGRPFSVLTPELIKAEKQRFAARPYNITRRAAELGIGCSTLSYHLRNGRAVRCGVSWRRRVGEAIKSANQGNAALAVRQLREAAQILEDSP